MALTFVQFHQTNSSGTSLTMNVPSGAAAGDLLIAVIHTAGTRVTASATDFGFGAGKWTLLFWDVQASSTDDVYVYWRIMQGGDTSWTWSTTGTVLNQAAILAYHESGTAKWLVQKPTVSADSSATTASAAGQVQDGVLIYGGLAWRSTGTLSTIGLSTGTSRVNVINAGGTHAIVLTDTIGTVNNTTVTSTTTGTAPTDHVAFTLAAQSTPTGELSDPGDDIDADGDATGYVYKGRDDATSDSTGAA